MAEGLDDSGREERMLFLGLSIAAYVYAQQDNLQLYLQLYL